MSKEQNAPVMTTKHTKDQILDAYNGLLEKVKAVYN